MSFWIWDVARSEAKRHREAGTRSVKEMGGIHEAEGGTGSRRTQNEVYASASSYNCLQSVKVFPFAMPGVLG